MLRLAVVAGIIGMSSVIASAPASAAPHVGPTCEQLPIQSLHCLNKEQVQPVKDFFTFDCHSAPSPQMPGSGFSGAIDGGKPAGNIDYGETLPIPTLPSDGPPDIYGVVGYPPPWHTYDLGCAGALNDSWAAIDTGLGNWEKGLATVLTALSNSLHRFVSPPNFMSHFDGVLQSASGDVRDALFSPYIGLSLLEGLSS